MFWTIVLALVVVGVARVLYAVFQCATSPLRHFPGPSDSLLFGVFREINGEPPCVPHIRWSQQYGSIYVYRLFLAPRLFITDLKWIQRILITNAANYIRPTENRSALLPILGDSLLTTEGSVHSKMRGAISPAFAFKNLQSFIPVFGAAAERLADMWSGAITASNDHKVQVDMHSVLAKLTLDVIGETAFGYKFNALGDPNNAIYQAYNDIFSVLTLSPLALLPYGNLIPTANRRRSWRGTKVIRAKVTEIIENSRKALKEGQKQNTNTLLHMLLSAEDPSSGKPAFTDDELMSHTLTFMVAGHETSSNGLCWLFYLLAQNPRVEAKLKEELRQQLNGRAPNWEDLKGLAYLQATVKEAMRLYSPVPIVSRVSVNDDEFNGTRIPAGTSIIISAGTLGRLPNLWKNPDEFMPERFLHSNDSENSGVEKEEPFAWLAFLAGVHSCIGSRFAQLEMACVLAVLLQRFTLRMVPGAPCRPKLFVTMRPYPSLLMHVSQEGKA